MGGEQIELGREYFPSINKYDLLSKLDPILHPNGPWMIDPETNKLWVPTLGLSKERVTPWVHIKQDGRRKCKIYTDVIEPYLHFIPHKCQNCWKVVFRPQYIKDMLNLIPLMRGLAEKHNFCCKLGAETRPWTSGVYGKWGLWGCYFYNNTQKQGIHCWETVLNAIAADDNLKHLLDDVDDDGYPSRLVLKRGCTEFEVMGKYGDSKDWVHTEENLAMERAVWNLFMDQDLSIPQSPEIQNHVIGRWFSHAHSAGDPTVKEFNEGTMLWRSTRYYHKEMFDAIKKKRAVKNALKKGGK
jgi:hypothetical protein